MDDRRSLQLAIDTPCSGVRVIRVAGALGPTGAARLMRLIDAQVQLVRMGQCLVAHLVLDLDAVTEYEPDALGALLRAEQACDEARISLHLAGFFGRLVLLPIRVRQLLVRFSAFPTVEVALASLDAEMIEDHAGGC